MCFGSALFRLRYKRLSADETGERLLGVVGEQRQKGLRAGENCFEHYSGAFVQICSVQSEKTVGIIVSFYVIKSAHAPNSGK